MAMVNEVEAADVKPIRTGILLAQGDDVLSCESNGEDPPSISPIRPRPIWLSNKVPRCLAPSRPGVVSRFVVCRLVSRRLISRGTPRLTTDGTYSDSRDAPDPKQSLWAAKPAAE